ncbi:MAG: roadblock/LC7 domain-containing protein [Thiomargarita sp.]|nr:roadblock/LC7 domain-containing protein [Thiomargarita sp.]
MCEEKLKTILAELNATSPDIEASAIISSDGLVVASVLSNNMDESRVGAMAAAMLSLGERTSQEFERGNLEQVLVKGDNGYILIKYAGENSLLAVITTRSAKLDLIFLDAERISEDIRKII